MIAKQFVSFLLLALVFVGCINLSKPNLSSEVKYYSFEPTLEGERNKLPEAISIELQRVSVSPRFQDNFLVYRSDEKTYESDYYNQFQSEPNLLLAEGLKKWLRHSDVFHFVDTSSSHIQTRYALHVIIEEIYADYRDELKPQAVLKMEFVFFDRDALPAELFFQKDYFVTVPMSKINVRTLISGWEDAFDSILKQFHEDIKRTLTQRGT